MRNKIRNLMWVMVCMAMFLPVIPAMADVDIDMVETIDVDSVPDMVPTEDDIMEQVAADAIASYDVDGSLFDQITTLEQEKVVMQLEKERAQLDLELNRLAAEKIKLQMELDTLSGRAEQQQQEFEVQKAKLEAEAARLGAEKERLAREVSAMANAPAPMPVTTSVAQNNDSDAIDSIATRWRLVNVIGAGNQLAATIEDLNNGQQRRISVGKTLDGYTVRAISLDDGVVFERDGNQQHLNIGGAN